MAREIGSPWSDMSKRVGLDPPGAISTPTAVEVCHTMALGPYDQLLRWHRFAPPAQTNDQGLAIAIQARYLQRLERAIQVEEYEAPPAIIACEYWNANGYAVAIVAVAGSNQDWTAYVGAQPDPAHRWYTEEWAARHGSKLTEEQAWPFFGSRVPGALAWRR